MLDPVAYSKAVERMVTKPSEEGLLRKYYRFRPARFYGGIATADAVGCNLNCAFCWVKEPRLKPWKYGEFYSPREVASKLEEIARHGRFSKVRVSGAEPTIGREHLVELINAIDKNRLFILETNGILIGCEQRGVCAAYECQARVLRLPVKSAGEFGEVWSEHDIFQKY